MGAHDTVAAGPELERAPDAMARCLPRTRFLPRPCMPACLPAACWPPANSSALWSNSLSCALLLHMCPSMALQCCIQS
jgi:hypothetical protein